MMKHINEEVITISAGKETLALLEETGIFTCPINSEMVKVNPLYFAFMEADEGGKITKLYTLKDKFTLNLNAINSKMQAFLQEKYGNDILEKLHKFPHPENTYFLFDKSKTITLPHPAKFWRAYRVRMANLSYFFEQPNEEGVVLMGTPYDGMFWHLGR